MYSVTSYTRDARGEGGHRYVVYFAKAASSAASLSLARAFSRSVSARGQPPGSSFTASTARSALLTNSQARSSLAVPCLIV